MYCIFGLCLPFVIICFIKVDKHSRIVIKKNNKHVDTLTKISSSYPPTPKEKKELYIQKYTLSTYELIQMIQQTRMWVSMTHHTRKHDTYQLFRYSTCLSFKFKYFTCYSGKVRPEESDTSANLPLWKESINGDSQQFHKSQQNEQIWKHLSPQVIEDRKDHDIWHWKSRSWLGTGTTMWRG